MNEIAPRPELPASGRAIASLVFGILGLVGFAPCIGPILAIVFGGGEPSGIAKAGVILGWVTLAIYAFVVFLAVVLLLIGMPLAFLSTN